MNQGLAEMPLEEDIADDEGAPETVPVPRSLVGLVLMIAQAFFYNAIFFTFALVLTDFFGIPANQVGWYILPFAAGNFLGPLLLGRLFDTLGRRTMITVTYGVSGVLLALSGYLFSIGALTAQTQTIAWMVIFFFASPAASAASVYIAWCARWNAPTPRCTMPAATAARS